MKNKVLLDKKAFERTINRMAHEIIEKNQGVEYLRFIGIRTRGVHLAQRIKQKIENIEHISLPLGVLDITMYRDDVFKLKSPELKKNRDSL
jgi:pyrimidine operon attenuation protein/uracil phosphoribosyltransferase